MEWGLVLGAVITAVLTVAGTVIVQGLAEKRSQLVYELSTSGDLVPTHPGIPLEIQYEARPVDHLVQVRCRWTNAGTVVLEQVPVAWQYEGSAEVVSISTSDPLLVVLGPGKCSIPLLHPGETVSIEWVVADDPSPRFSVSARSSQVLATPVRPQVQAGRALAWGQLIALLVVAVAFFWSASNLLTGGPTTSPGGPGGQFGAPGVPGNFGGPGFGGPPQPGGPGFPGPGQPAPSGPLQLGPSRSPSR